MIQQYAVEVLKTHSMKVENESERIIKGVLSVECVDRDGEITIRDELLKTMDIWLKRGAPLSLSHTNQIIGKGLDYWASDVEVNGKSVPAIEIKAMIYNDTLLDDQVWDQLKKGELKGFSYGGSTRSGREAQVQPDGTVAYLLKDLEVYEVAVCPMPTCQFALITDVNKLAKGIDVKGIDRGNGQICIQCDKFKCVVQKEIEEDGKSSQKEPLIYYHKSRDSKKMADQDKTTETEKAVNLENATVKLADYVDMATKAKMYDLRKEEDDKKDKEEDKKDKSDDKKDDSKDDKKDAEKSFEEKTKAWQEEMTGLMTEFVKKMDERVTRLEKNSGVVKGDDSNAKNDTTVTLPDADGETASMNPKDKDNTDDKVKVAKATRPGVASGEEDSVNQILEDARKGNMPSMKIAQKIRNKQYRGMGASE